MVSNIHFDVVVMFFFKIRFEFQKCMMYDVMIS